MSIHMATVLYDERLKFATTKCISDIYLEEGTSLMVVAYTKGEGYRGVPGNDDDGTVMYKVNAASVVEYNFDANGMEFNASIKGVDTYICMPVDSICALAMEGDPTSIVQFPYNLKGKKEEVQDHRKPRTTGFKPSIVK